MLMHRTVAKLQIETLEDRTVPATLVSPTTMTFQDVDGDIAAVVFSKPVLANYNVDQVFQFDVGSVNGSNAQRQSLRKIDLSVLSPVDINGADMTVKVIKRGSQGNGEVHVGSVFSLGETYGKLDFQGDVGVLEMYQFDGDRKLADSISVNSTGRFDPYGNSLQSNLIGSITSFLVRGDLVGSVAVALSYPDLDVSQTVIGKMEVRGSVKGSFFTSDRIDHVLIRGDIDGTAYPAPPIYFPYLGRFQTGGVTTLKLLGSVIGGTFEGSGQLFVDGTGQSKLGTVTIGGSIRGNSAYSGQAIIYGAFQSITVKGSVIGGEGLASGQLNPGEANTVFVDGSIIGGSGYQSGAITNQTVNAPYTNVMEKLQIKGNIIGGGAQNSGSVEIVNPVKRFTLAGIIQGGSVFYSGRVMLDAGSNYTQVQAIIGGAGNGSGNLVIQSINSNPFAMQTVVLKSSLVGGSEYDSGNIYVQGASQVRINGSVIGATGFHSGVVTLFPVGFGDTESNLSIMGSVIGGTGYFSGAIEVDSTSSRVSVLGSFIGAQGNNSGSLNATVSMSSITVGGTLRGGKGKSSGIIQAQTIEDVRIGGSILGGEGELAGGINVLKRLGSVHINGSLAGNYGYVYVGKYVGDGYLDSIWIGGDVRNSGIVSTGAIGTVTVLGSILGTDAAPSYVIAYGITPSSAGPSDPYLLQRLTVVGNVTGTNIYMGNYSFDQMEVARVGRIAVGGNWSNNLLTVGYAAGADGQWGTEDDVRISPDAPSSIDSLFIVGNILGSHTSLVQAGLITQLKLKQTIIKLTPGEFNDDLVLSQLLRVREKV